MVLVHVGAYVPVISVAQDRNIVEKHIRPLQSQLVEPAVLGDNTFQLVVGKIIVGLHTENIVSGKSWHKYRLLSMKNFKTTVR